MTFEQIILVINAFLATTTVIIAVMTYMNRNAIHELHLSLNSRLTELLEATKGASLAEGRELGRSENRDIVQP